MESTYIVIGPISVRVRVCVCLFVGPVLGRVTYIVNGRAERFWKYCEKLQRCNNIDVVLFVL